MDLQVNRRKKTPKVIVSNSLKDTYPHDLQLYTLPPGNEIQLSEFEELALERLNLFRIIEQASQKGHRIFSDEWKECIYGDLLKNQLKKYYRLAKSSDTENSTDADLQARRADHISHYILRLAYCRTEPLRKWFLSRELEWFKLRFQQQSTKSIEKFLKLNNLTYTPISEEEKSKFYEKLSESTANVSVVDSVDFYKVKFTEVPSLVKSRRVFIHKGYAYVPRFELVTCILGIFRASLNKALVYACRRLPQMDDDRISFLISNLHHIYTGKDYSTNNNLGKISLANLDQYAREHFPLCMRHLYGIMKTNHHLKHYGRFQLRLFLKGIGLNYEDNMTFWREEFTKIMDTNKFEKDYAYDIKHIYGLVGSKTSYSPYSCIKLISCNVGPGEHHGCPFKHWDSTCLTAKLNEYGMSSEDIENIVGTASKGHYQVACSKYFKAAHGQQNEIMVNHPNQYFEESFELTKESKGQDKEKAQGATKSMKKQKSAPPQVTVDDVNWDEEM